jgi:hypothetical protein
MYGLEAVHLVEPADNGVGETTMTLIRWALMSASSRCRAGRSVDSPEKPPSSLSRANQRPASMGLTADIGLRGIILGVQ